MANRFLNNITINDQYTFPSTDGTNGQILSTTGAADGTTELVFVDQSTLNSGSAERTEILVKNVHGSALSKGDPVYIVGSVGASDRLEVALADASDAAKMPCVGLLTQDLANNGEGTATVTGKLRNLITSPIDGATPTENDTLYVKPGGGLTLTKPTGVANLIQNVGQVGRVSTSSDGNIVVSAILRSNDVPNLTTGKIWVGSTGNTIESATVHLDEANGRMGIGTAIPGQKLDVNGNVNVGTSFSGTIYFATSTTGPKIVGTNPALGGALDLSTGGSTRLRIDNVGRVGIGTTTPGEKLHVDGNIRVGDSADTVFSNRFYALSNAHVYLLANSGYDLKFYAGGTEKMVVSSAGNVGIGTASPSQKLQVEGNSWIKGIYYDTSGDAGTSGQVLSSTATGTNWITLNDIYYTETESDARFVNVTGDTMTGTLDVHVNDIGTILKSGNSSATNTPDQFFLKHNFGNVEIGNSRGNINITSGNVGIGTTSTAYKLDIQAESPAIRIRDISDANSFLVGADNSGGYLGMFTNDSLRVYTNSSERMRVTSNGNFGIGNTSPSYKLSIAGSSSAQLEIINSLNSKSWRPNVNGNDFYITETGVGNPFVIQAGGNVGIGTTSPTEALHVVGNGIFTGEATVGDKLYLTNVSSSGADGILAFDSTDTTGGSRIFSFTRGSGNSLKYHSYGYHLWQSGPASGTSDSTNRMILDSSGRLGIGTTNPQQKLQVASPSDTSVVLGASYLSTNNNNFFEVGINANDGYLNLKNSGVSTTVHIDSDGDSYFNGGNVGIGTSSPNNELEILGSNSPRISLRTSSETTGEALELGFQIGTGANASSNTVGLIKSVITQADPSSLIGDLEFQTNSGDSASTKMTIKGGGNVGIGTTNPTLTYGGKGLHIENSDTAGIMLNDTTGAKFNIAARSSDVLLYTNTDHRLRFGINGQERMRIETSGNVGIGTTSPGGKLDVAGDTDARVILGRAKFDNYVSDYLYLSHFDQGSATNYALNQSPAGSTSINAPTGQNVALKINNSAKLHIQGTTGNVGIGTTSPNATLDVNGAGNFSGGTVVSGIDSTQTGVAIPKGMYLKSNDGNYLRNIIGHTSSGNIEVGQDATSLIGDILLRPGAAGNIRFFGSGSEDMRINSSGDVGIGTTSPGYKLDVSGGARAGGVVTYSKTYTSLDTTGNAVAGLTTGSNGNSAGFTFTCFGHTGEYQKVVYSCYNVSGTWNTIKVIDEGTNAFDIEASANAATITFTFKSTSGTKSYSPRVTVEATGSAINSTYA